MRTYDFLSLFRSTVGLIGFSTCLTTEPGRTGPPTTLKKVREIIPDQHGPSRIWSQ